MTIGEICAKHGVTMAEISRMYNIPYQTMQNWNAGRRDAPEYVLILIDKCLNYEMERKNE